VLYEGRGLKARLISAIIVQKELSKKRCKINFKNDFLLFIFSYSISFQTDFCSLITQ